MESEINLEALAKQGKEKKKVAYIRMGVVETKVDGAVIGFEDKINRKC